MNRDDQKDPLLRREISLALVIKLILLLLLWMLFFRTPAPINPQDITNTLFAAPANGVPNR